MGIVCQNIETENWINAFSQDWKILNDQDYRQLIETWKRSFWYDVETRQRSPYGDKARIKFQSLLPACCYIFSGIRVETAANMGGKISQGYSAEGLAKIDWDLCITEEIIISFQDFSYTIVCSHEEGYETFYESV